MGKKIRISEAIDNVYLWGISTAFSELKLVLFINRHLHVDLRRSINIMNKVSLPREGFITFTYVSEKYELPVRYILYVNRTGGYTLFSSFPQFDYLLALMGSVSAHEIKRTVSIMRSIEGINAFISLDPYVLKQDREYLLLFD